MRLGVNDSAPGRGSRFQVLLPRVPAVTVATEEASRPSPARAEGWILVVDDEAGVRDVTRALLEEGGYRAICADSGARALTLLGERVDEIQAVMLDLTMPGMSGEETFAELRRLREELPVVCCSGFGTEVGTEWIAGKSRVAFLAKPFTRDRILETLNDLLHGDETASGR